MTRKNGILGWCLLWLLLFWCFWIPIAFSALKALTVVVLLLIPLGAFLLWPRARIYLSVLLVACQFVLFWPTRPADPARLRRSYVAALRSYRETPYVWGGENGRGMDCSGLIRRGMMDALWYQGWAERNPSLWTEAATLWWRDCSAREMMNGYGGRIQNQFEARNLNILNNAGLQIGDLAVMQSGVHVLAYIGDDNWIQADPNLADGGDKVIVTHRPSNNGWFRQPIVICRWKLLATPHA